MVIPTPADGSVKYLYNISAYIHVLFQNFLQYFYVYGNYEMICTKLFDQVFTMIKNKFRISELNECLMNNDLGYDIIISNLIFSKLNDFNLKQGI